MSCAHCRDADSVFAGWTVRRELRRFRKRGAAGGTKRLVEAILTRVEDPFTLLDIGGGVGAIQHAALEAGADRVVNADASGDYQAAVKREASQRGTLDRIRFLEGDFVDRAGEVEPMDVVTLDRVLCCYPDMPALVRASTDRARRLYGVVFPREQMLQRIGVRLVNLWMAARRSEFRVYLHGTERIVSEVEGRGLQPVWRDSTLLWRTVLFERVSEPPAAAS